MLRLKIKICQEAISIFQVRVDGVLDKDGSQGYGELDFDYILIIKIVLGSIWILREIGELRMIRRFFGLSDQEDGKYRNLVLDKLNVRCLLDVFVKKLIRWLDI